MDRPKTSLTYAAFSTHRLKSGAVFSPQVDILDRFFIHRTRGHVDSLAADYHIERTRVYDLKDAAIDDFTIARYGIIDS